MIIMIIMIIVTIFVIIIFCGDLWEKTFLHKYLPVEHNSKVQKTTWKFEHSLAYTGLGISNIDIPDSTLVIIVVSPSNKEACLVLAETSEDLRKPLLSGRDPPGTAASLYT